MGGAGLGEESWEEPWGSTDPPLHPSVRETLSFALSHGTNITVLGNWWLAGSSLQLINFHVNKLPAKVFKFMNKKYRLQS